MPSWRLGKLSRTPSNSNTPPPDPRRTPDDATKDDPLSALTAADVSQRGGPAGIHRPFQGASRPASSPSRSRAHSRNVSQNIPAIFGGIRKKSNVGLDNSSYAEFPPREVTGLTNTSPKDKTQKYGDNDFESGSCMTCDSKLRYPRGISEFRCATCLMINCLKPVQKRTPSPLEDLSETRPVRPSGTFQGIRVNDKELTLSIERTMAIIDQCLNSYLQARQALSELRNANASRQQSSMHGATTRPILPEAHAAEKYIFTPQSDDPKMPTPVNSSLPITGSFHNTGEIPSIERHLLNGRAPADSKDANDITPPSPLQTSILIQRQSHEDIGSGIRRKPTPVSIELPSRPPPPIPDSARLSPSNTFFGHPARIVESPQTEPEDPLQNDKSKAIFRPLEDYLVRSFGNIDCLNISFMTPNPKARGCTRSDNDIRHRPLRKISRNTSVSDIGISDLDAKTLLLGDVAENGLWWTGEDDRATGESNVKNHVNQLVHTKTPRIDWPEVSRWYNTVITAGDAWRKIKSQTQQQHPSVVGKFAQPDEDIKLMEEAVSESLSHVHFTLLKLSESLLKRPGRPLKRPDDIRFLLILLENPLLYPNSTAFRKSYIQEEGNIRDDKATVMQSNALYAPDLGKMAAAKDLTTPWDRGQVFGVIKRVIGLLSNLSNDCHRYLTVWFSRLDEEHFRRLIDLLERFVTRRLARQPTHKSNNGQNPTDNLVPSLSGSNAETPAQLHAALGLSGQTQRGADGGTRLPPYSDDWQLKATARVMALLFSANRNYSGKCSSTLTGPMSKSGLAYASSMNTSSKKHQLLPNPDFYNTLLDYADIVADFDAWESKKGKFSFCQYPFFLSIGAKIRIMEHDARRQMEVKAREAFFNSLLQNKVLEQYLVLKVRRDCLVEDSMKNISEVVGAGQEEIKKGLKIHFVNEEGVDAGGLRKEWFLLLIREIFDPRHGMFLYDEDSRFCYFNPHSFETSDQFFLVGALLGLAIYNSTILDIALPPFTFKRLLMSGLSANVAQGHFNKGPVQLTLDDLAEYRPSLAHGLRQLLEYDGDVQGDFCRDFVVDVDRFGSIVQVPLCPNGEGRQVTNANRREFVDLYIRYFLDTSVARQFEPFKRGFFTVCGGNALSLFQPEEIELLVRGSDEPLDVRSLKAVALYQNWRRDDKEIESPSEIPLIQWFWNFFESAEPKDQRKLLSFITGSDRIPAVGAANLIIKIAFAGKNRSRFPVARTCFNTLLLYKYLSREELAEKLWRAVTESEGFGLK